MKTFFVAHSYGELENFFSLALSTNKKYRLIIYKKNIYERLFKDTIFNKILIKKKIKLIYLNSYFKKIFGSFFFFFFSSKIYISDSLPLIYSKFFFVLSKIFFKERIIISHSTTPLSGLNKNYKPRNLKRDINCTYFVNNKNEYKIYKKIGYKNIYLIKNPYKNKKYIDECKKVKFKKKKFTLLYSSGHHDIIFNKAMRERQYKIFFTEYRKVFKERLVIVKPHPGETINEIKKVLKKISQLNNVEISEENTLLLTLNASESVAFLNGGIFCSLFNSIPTMNFYLWYPKYNMYLKSLNQGHCHILNSKCKTASNQKSLIKALKKLKYSK